jgi:hypothetical protein
MMSLALLDRDHGIYLYLVFNYSKKEYTIYTWEKVEPRISRIEKIT